MLKCASKTDSLESTLENCECNNNISFFRKITNYFSKKYNERKKQREIEERSNAVKYVPPCIPGYAYHGSRKLVRF